MGFHPWWNFEEAGIVVSDKGTLLSSPGQVSDASDLVDSIGDVLAVADFKLIDSVGHVDLEAVGVSLGGTLDLENEVEVGREFAILGVEGNLVLAEVGFGSGSQFVEQGQDLAFGVVESHFIIDGWVWIGTRLSWEEPEERTHYFEVLLCLETIIPDLEPEFVKNQDISNSDFSGEVLDTLGVQENRALVVRMTRIDNFQTHAVIFFWIFSMGVGAIHN
jgi:hypothetical protein